MKKAHQAFLIFLALFIIGALGLTGCSPSGALPPDVINEWDPPDEIDATLHISCEENRALFAYDENAPLDIQEVSRRREEGATIIDLTYASPMGGRVPATLVVPDGAGPFAGIIYQHGMPSTRQLLIPNAVTFARMGAVVILIDAPFARPEHGSPEPLAFTEQDRREQIQLIIDLRRAVDLLLSRSDVDSQRLAYVGISYGGAMGGLLAGIENRIKGYVLQVGDGGLVTHFTGVEDRDWWQAKPEETRRQWVAWMWPIEPIHYVACASPAKLLFQNGALDKMVPPADAMRYQNAGSEPKTILWYKNGHGLGTAAGRDQAKWLSKVIGIDNYRPIPRSAEIILTVWFFMIAGSLVFLIWTLWKTNPASNGIRLQWLLTTTFLGPIGLIVYWISQGQHHSATKSNESNLAQRAFASATWASTGNALGGIGVLALLLYIPQVFSAYLVMQIGATFLVPFCMGWLIFAISKWISRANPSYSSMYRYPVFANAASTCWALVGIYPTVNILMTRYFGRWATPFSIDLSYVPLWGALCIAALIGTLTTFPFHLWMLQRSEIHWGEVTTLDEKAPKRLSWYSQILILTLSILAMLGAIFLSLQTA